jgi:RimJ/RimL family protein N-acetyltransferase
MRERWTSSEASTRVLTLGAFDEAGAFVGLLGVHPEREGHPWISHVGIFGMMLLKAYWGQGLGRRMLEILDSFVLRPTRMTTLSRG